MRRGARWASDGLGPTTHATAGTAEWPEKRGVLRGTPLFLCPPGIIRLSGAIAEISSNIGFSDIVGFSHNNLHRAELTKLERDEHIAEWIRLTDEKNKLAQVGPVSLKGGHGVRGGRFPLLNLAVGQA